jgi:hypothetical protein
MGLFRRQGRVATVASMSQFTEDERELGMDMLQAAESCFVGLGAPSALGTALFSACVASIGVESETSEWGALAGAMLMGYACRLTQADRDIPDVLVAVIEAQLVRAPDGRLDNEAMADEPQRLELLVEQVAAMADDGDLIAAMTGVSVGTWDAFATTATYQLHKNLIRNGMSKRMLPPVELLRRVLRLGYAVRVVDEVAGESPMDRDGGTISTRESTRPLPAGAALDVEEWLSEASHVCAHDFEPFAERVLELGALGAIGVIDVGEYVLGKPPLEPIGDDAVTAVSNARFGYALRNRECQLVTGTGRVEPGDSLAVELDDRASGVRHAVLDGLIRDVLDSNRFGGGDRVFDSMPGTTSDARRAAIRGWAEQHYPGDDPRTGREITQHLVEYGYLLHRLLELRPGYFD